MTQNVQMGHVAANLAAFFRLNSSLIIIIGMLIQEINALYYDVNNRQTVIVKKDEVRLEKKISDVIESLCNQYGLSKQGSITAIKNTLKIYQKCPVLVHPILQIYLFPTLSMYDKECLWINSKLIEKVSREEFSTVIHFKDKTQLLCNVGIRSIKKQINRCRMMEERIITQYQIDQLFLKL
jgi:competence protein ComK